MHRLERDIIALNDLLKRTTFESGIHVSYSEYGFFFQPPARPVTLSEEELFTWGVERFNNLRCQEGVDFQQFRKDVIAEAREFKKLDGIGGVGIHNRNLQDIETSNPSIYHNLNGALEKETGKIVILGNGFSNIPVCLASRYQQGLLETPPIVVDLFDYKLAFKDILYVNSLMEERGYFFKILRTIRQDLSDICDAINMDELRTISYFVGEGNPPTEIRNASLLINIFGPPKTTYSEQYSLLQEMGILITERGMWSKGALRHEFH